MCEDYRRSQRDGDHDDNKGSPKHSFSLNFTWIDAFVEVDDSALTDECPGNFFGGLGSSGSQSRNPFVQIDTVTWAVALPKGFVHGLIMAQPD
jgi:hypothetical protein